MSSKTETAFALLDEIREMQQTVDYLQLRILRKQVAIAEVMNSLELDLDKEWSPASTGIVITTEAEPPVTPTEDGRQTYPNGERINGCKLIRQVIETMNGATFYYDQLTEAAMKLCPRASFRDIKRATYPVIRNMIAEGKVIRVPGGFRRVV